MKNERGQVEKAGDTKRSARHPLASVTNLPEPNIQRKQTFTVTTSKKQQSRDPASRLSQSSALPNSILDVRNLKIQKQMSKDSAISSQKQKYLVQSSKKLSTRGF